jgi:thioredoxin-like negative regulator of GroEL
VPPLDAAARRARVAEAVRVAGELTAHGKVADAVSLLHGVVLLAGEEEKRAIRLLLARAYVSERSWHRYGRALLDDMVRENPYDADALALQGAFYRREGLLSRAEATLRRALAACPGHAAARAELQDVTRALARRCEPAPPPLARRGIVARILSIGR